MNPFDELGDLSEAEAAIDADVDRRMDEAGYDEGSQRKAYDLGWTDEAPQTALLLTQQEWDDLCVMLGLWCSDYRVAVGNPDVVEETLRRRSLAQRIIEANQ
jgi:hypothetical protein